MTYTMHSVLYTVRRSSDGEPPLRIHQRDLHDQPGNESSLGLETEKRGQLLFPWPAVEEKAKEARTWKSTKTDTHQTRYPQNFGPRSSAPFSARLSTGC